MHISLDVRAGNGEQGLQDRPARLLVVAVFERGRGGAECFFQKSDADAQRLADATQRCQLHSLRT